MKKGTWTLNLYADICRANTGWVGCSYNMPTDECTYTILLSDEELRNYVLGRANELVDEIIARGRT
jgi:hypothetical protein